MERDQMLDAGLAPQLAGLPRREVALAHSITLAGAKVSLIGKTDRFQCGEEDVNGDGLDDLVCHVITEEFLIEEGDSVAVLEGETFGGTPIRGEDQIQIVPD
ncbi:MAG TPA: hypothetical protein VGB09_02095 [Candidatus Binatia bacterium]